MNLDKELYAKYKAILKFDGTKQFAPLDWDKYPAIDKIIKNMLVTWTNEARKTATKKLRAIIRKHKQATTI